MSYLVVDNQGQKVTELAFVSPATAAAAIQSNIDNQLGAVSFEIGDILFIVPEEQYDELGEPGDNLAKSSAGIAIVSGDCGILVAKLVPVSLLEDEAE